MGEVDEKALGVREGLGEEGEEGFVTVFFEHLVSEEEFRKSLAKVEASFDIKQDGGEKALGLVGLDKVSRGSGLVHGKHLGHGASVGHSTTDLAARSAWGVIR